MASSIALLPPELPWSSPREAQHLLCCVLWSEAGLAKWTGRSISAQSELYARSCHGEAGKAEILLELLSAERAIHTYPHRGLSQPMARAGRRVHCDTSKFWGWNFTLVSLMQPWIPSELAGRQVWLHTTVNAGPITGCSNPWKHSFSEKH